MSRLSQTARKRRFAIEVATVEYPPKPETTRRRSVRASLRVTPLKTPSHQQLLPLVPVKVQQLPIPQLRQVRHRIPTMIPHRLGQLLGVSSVALRDSQSYSSSLSSSSAGTSGKSNSGTKLSLPPYRRKKTSPLLVLKVNRVWPSARVSDRS